MKLLYTGCSECGQVRAQNEDSILMRASGSNGIFVVADGVGGKTDGEVASRLICEGYALWWKRHQEKLANSSFQDVMESLKTLLVKLNDVIVTEYGPMKIGSTAAILYLAGAQCLYLSVGDSRIYRARGLSFRQVTVDDVYENYREKDEAFDRRSVGKLTSAVGSGRNLEFSVRTDSVNPGDRFFLCSDGVYKFVSPNLLRWKISLGNHGKILGDLSEEVERRGAKDNYSMIFVKAE